MKGKLCCSGFQPGTGIEWMIRSETGRTATVYVLYRDRSPYSRHNSPESAYASFHVHVPPDERS